MTAQPPLIDVGEDDNAPSKFLRWLWASQGKMPAGYTCGGCSHYQETNQMCLMVGPMSYDWRKEWQACGLWQQR